MSTACGQDFGAFPGRVDNAWIVEKHDTRLALLWLFRKVMGVTFPVRLTPQLGSVVRPQ